MRARSRTRTRATSVRPAILALALAACTPPAPEHSVMHSPSLATLRLRTPAGALFAYDATGDQWIVATPHDYAIVTAAAASSVASPDAFVHAIAPGATIAARESLSDGFAVTAAGQTYVVKELGSTWVTCTGSVVLCKSLKRGY